MNIRIPQELIQYLDSVRGEKSRQAYLINLLAEEQKNEGVSKLITSALKGKK